MDEKTWPARGCGLGLRSPHYPVILERWPRVDWFEAVTENYMDTGGRPLQVLEAVRRRYPIALHGTALSIGSTDPMSERYLERLKRLVDRIDPFLVTDHLCWSGVKGEQLHDLLPLPFTEEAVRHVVSRVGRVQELLGRKILLENVSTYVTYRDSTMTEWAFLKEIAERSGCGLLLDLNNVFVNSVNHGFDALEYLENIPARLVGQIHLAGYTDMGDFLFDTHSRPIVEKVWDLYREAMALWGPVSTLVEWDEDIPEFDALVKETEKARVIYDAAAGQARRVPAIRTRAAAAPPPRNAAALSLAEAQDFFRKTIQPRPDAEREAPEGLLNPQGGVPGVERLSVYAGGYTARLHEALAEVFVGVKKTIGDELFSGLTHVYASRYPSHDYNLNFVGVHVPEFLAGSPLSKEFPYLADLARLEWGTWLAFHAFNEPPMKTEDLAGIPPEDWERAQIVFQPSTSLFVSDWSLLDLWLKRSRPEELPRPARAAERLLIGRRGELVRCERLSADQHGMIEGLLAGKTLGAVCETLAESDEPPPIADWFAAWVRDGLIVRCDILQQNGAA
ncbi:MAG TPA: DUF692 family protein [Candidatus Eisenbacteria bacterium]|nr:DUF692 family protein [Candidatus Eisenbacteria bacterium]